MPLGLLLLSPEPILLSGRFSDMRETRLAGRRLAEGKEQNYSFPTANITTEFVTISYFPQCVCVDVFKAMLSIKLYYTCTCV